MTKEELLKLVENYVKNEPNKNWRPGKDHVHYAGPYFDHNEIVKYLKENFPEPSR